MFKVLILVCSLNIAPQDCEMNNAFDVIAGPMVASKLSCGFSGRAFIAATMIAPGRRQ